MPDEITWWVGALIAIGLTVTYFLTPRASSEVQYLFDQHVCGHDWFEADDWHICHRPIDHTGPHVCAHDCEAMDR